VPARQVVKFRLVKTKVCQSKRRPSVKKTCGRPGEVDVTGSAEFYSSARCRRPSRAGVGRGRPSRQGSPGYNPLRILELQMFICDFWCNMDASNISLINVVFCQVIL
jgi:hypothetical protein